MNYPEQVLARVPPPQRKLITALRSLIRKVVPEAKETVLWDSLSYHRPVVGGRVKGAVCLITPRTDAVHLGFIHGAALADPDHLLQGSRKSKRYIPVRRMSDIDAKSLSGLLRAAAKYQPGSASHVTPAALAFMLGFCCLLPLRGAESAALKSGSAPVLTRAQMESDFGSKEEGPGPGVDRTQRDADLILDLRGNGGGSDALGHFLAHCLCAKDDVSTHQWRKEMTANFFSSASVRVRR